MNKQEIDEFNRAWKEDAERLMASSPREKMAFFRAGYESDIKPLILEGKYDWAATLLEGIVGVIKLVDTRILLVHCGFEYFTAAENLARCLREGTGIEKAIERFEAYNAQTKLPWSWEIDNDLQ